MSDWTRSRTNRSASGKRARERAQRAELADVFLQRGRRPMIERIAACGPALEEVEHAAHDRLQRNRALVSGSRHRGHQIGNPRANTRRSLGLLLRVGAVRVGLVRIAGASFVALAEAPEGETVGGPAPPGLSTREHTSGLSGREPLVLLDAHVARLQQAAEMPGREICFNPVAESEQRSARARERGGDARPQRHGPVVAKRLLPHQRQMRVRGTGDLHLVQRDAGGQNPTKDFLDLRLAATGVKQLDLRLRSAACRDDSRASSETPVDSCRARPSVAPRAATSSRRGIDTPGSSNVRGVEPFARQAIEERPLKRVPVGVRKLGPAVLRLNRTPVRDAARASWYTVGHVGALVLVQEALVGRQQRDDLRVLRGRCEGVGRELRPRRTPAMRSSRTVAHSACASVGWSASGRK